MDRFLSVATPAEREALWEATNELQIKELQVMFNSLAYKCFNRCVNNFRARQLDTQEKDCINHCAHKYLQHMQRVGMRFAEETGMASQAQAAAAAQQAGTQQ